MMSSRTKWTSINQKTKKIVFERDNRCCIFCGSPYGLPEAHAILSRSQGGSGGEKNIVTACRYTCHRKLDSGTKEERLKMKIYAENYLKSKYDDWDIEQIKFRKGWEYD